MKRLGLVLIPFLAAALYGQVADSDHHWYQPVIDDRGHFDVHSHGDWNQFRAEHF